MKRLTLICMLICLAPLSFAAWQVTAALAIITSATLLAILFMVGMGFGINELQMTAKEELFQLIAVVIMMALLAGGDGILNVVSNAFVVQGGGSTMQESATAILNQNLADTDAMFLSIRSVDHAIAKEASKGGSCNVIQVGYSVSACGGYSMLPTPLSMAGNIAGYAYGELASMLRFIQISSAFALSFILPLGIVMRTFKLTRGAGGFLIALAISMHILLPMGVIFNEMMAVTFLELKDPAADAALVTQYKPYTGTPSVPECNSMDTGGVIPLIGNTDFKCNANAPAGGSADSYVDSSVWNYFTNSGNDGNAVGTYCMLRADIKGYLYLTLVKATLGPVLALLMMMAGIRTLTSIAGAEVDVSAISRLV